MSYTQDQCQSANLSHKPQYRIEYMLVLLKHLLGLLVSPSMKFHNIDTELKKTYQCIIKLIPSLSCTSICHIMTWLWGRANVHNNGGQSISFCVCLIWTRWLCHYITSIDINTFLSWTSTDSVICTCRLSFLACVVSQVNLTFNLVVTLVI